MHNGDCPEVLSYPEALHHVAACNVANSLHEARKKANRAAQPAAREAPARPWLPELLSLVRTLYPQAVIISDHATGDEKEEAAASQPACIVNLRLLVVEQQWIFLFFDLEEHTLGSVTRFSPAFLQGNNFKLLFLVYQLVRIVQVFSRRNVYPGDVNLKDFAVTETLQVQLLPDFCQLLSPSGDSTGTRLTVSNPAASSHVAASTSPLAADSLCDMVQGWVAGAVSNLDYLLYLNRLTGRWPGDPNFHPVLPWVTDFSSDSVSALRDLTKSEFRLNKGDEALDRTYESGDHHVTAVLSEITYYTYMARVTERSILCKYVRPTWVPGEYPRSIQRLQQWSPDESIPEFYLSPDVFRSIHADLPDLELPPWTPTPEGM